MGGICVWSMCDVFGVNCRCVGWEWHIVWYGYVCSVCSMCCVWCESMYVI